MPSTFGWVDFAEQDRQRMADVIHLFREQDTRDELGLGSVRDAFANLLFPGTSTVQTRAKYMLFVPWIYLRHEELEIPSMDIAQKARSDELNLIEALLDSGDTEGVIGKDARRKLQRLPSSIYWSGLGTWGIRLFRHFQKNNHPKGYGGTGSMRTNHFSKPGKRSKRFSSSFISFGVKRTPVG